MKDLYAILECSPSDNLNVIKKRYRKLAQQFHPDKNPNDKFAEAKFYEIKEAYEILTSPQRKELWLQERWLHQVMNVTNFETQPLTPHLILFQILQWEKEIYHTDRFRLNIMHCEKKLQLFLSDKYIHCMVSFNEPELQRQILAHLIKAMTWLPPDLTEKFTDDLYKIAYDCVSDKKMIKDFINQKKNEKSWNLYKIPLIIFITATICYFIMKMSS